MEIQKNSLYSDPNSMDKEGHPPSENLSKSHITHGKPHIVRYMGRWVATVRFSDGYIGWHSGKHKMTAYRDMIKFCQSLGYKIERYSLEKVDVRVIWENRQKALKAY